MGTKLSWILIIIFTGIIGEVVYLVVGRPVRPASKPASASGGSPYIKSTSKPQTQDSLGFGPASAPVKGGSRVPASSSR
jgi:hypothetical protein